MKDKFKRIYKIGDFIIYYNRIGYVIKTNDKNNSITYSYVYNIGKFWWEFKIKNSILRYPENAVIISDIITEKIKNNLLDKMNNFNS